jgi:hypothetical protein
MNVRQMIALGVAGVVLMASAATAATAKPCDLSKARAATAGYHHIDKAVAAGYAEFRDAQGIACIDNPAGGMGIHYVKLSLVDGVVNPAAPEALVYEPQRNGRLRLVAAEYIVPAAAWSGSEPPSLFGQEFELIGSPNRYGLDPFYELHAWLWKHNPSGMFEDWNPRVECPAA